MGQRREREAETETAKYSTDVAYCSRRDMSITSTKTTTTFEGEVVAEGEGADRGQG